ncbi:hypothetical protein EV360DRAFT_67710 [Lentinula raphanica]|nr:hypothetical protein EV360DRAFT_67710 [Lentinula raphanica]
MPKPPRRPQRSTPQQQQPQDVEWLGLKIRPLGPYARPNPSTNSVTSDTEEDNIDKTTSDSENSNTDDIEEEEDEESNKSDDEDDNNNNEDNLNSQKDGNSHRCVQLVKRRKTAKKAPKPRKRIKAQALSPSMQRIRIRARALARIAHPFVQFRTVVDIKIDHLAGKELEESDMRWLAVYDVLEAHIPAIGKLIRKSNHTKLDALVDLIQEAANQAKHGDTAALRHAIERLLPEDPDERISPRFHDNFKTDRGLNHLATRALLCPQRYIHRIDDNDFLGELINGEITLLAEDFPALMYDQAKVVDPSLENGLLEGYLPIRVARYILNGPSAAIDSSRKKKGSNATKHGITTMTGRLIAYAVIQARFAISAMEEWDNMDGDFDALELYEYIVDIFEDDPEDAKATELIAFWNTAVFDNPAGRDVAKTLITKSLDPQSAAAKYRAARLERRKAREQVEATGE